MQPLENVLPSNDGILYVFYDFESTQNKQYSDRAKVYFPTWFAYNSSVRDTRVLKIANGIVNSVDFEKTRSGTIQWVTCYRISANRDLGSSR